MNLLQELIRSKLTGGEGGGQPPSGTISITENGTYDVAQFAEAEVEVHGGDTLESDFLTVYRETVEVGENTVANSSQYHSYLSSIKSIPGKFAAMSIHKKASYTNNEWANGAAGIIDGHRFRNGNWQSATWDNSGWDAVAPVGTLVDVYTVELKNPNNVQ